MSEDYSLPEVSRAIQYTLLHKFGIRFYGDHSTQEHLVLAIKDMIEQHEYDKEIGDD